MYLPNWAIILICSLLGYCFTLWKTKPEGHDPFGWGRMLSIGLSTLIWIIILLAALLINEWAS